MSESSGKKALLQPVQSLRREVSDQIALVHRRDRVHAHDRMPVDSMDFPVQRCREQIAEGAVAAQARLAADDSDNIRREPRCDFCRRSAPIEPVSALESKVEHTL